MYLPSCASKSASIHHRKLRQVLFHPASVDPRKTFANHSTPCLISRMKWFIAALAAVLIAGFVYWQRQGVKVSYVNGLATYSALPNREYIFQRDCYLFKLDDRSSSWPYVGDQAVVASLPAEVDPKHLSVDYPGGRLIDVVRTYLK